MKLTIGEKITLLRKEKNITQTELAEYLFLAPQTISRWETGKNISGKHWRRSNGVCAS